MSLLKSILSNLSVPIKESDLTVGDMIYKPHKILHCDLTKAYKVNSISQTMKRAANRGFTKNKIINEQVYIALTQSGEEELGRLKDTIKFNLSSENKDWDGKYRLVLFDIPEKNRVVRDNFRNKLKQLGFIGWQQSVWVGKGDITRVMRKFLNKYGLSGHVLVIETKDLGNSELEGLLKETQ